MTATPRRAYRSAVREDAAAATRDRILAAAEAILADEGVAALTFQRLAAVADVSVPTVYRHFRGPDELLGAFFLWFRPRVGMSHEALFSGTLEDLAELPARNFPAFERHGKVLRALIDSPEANRVRERALADRPARAAANFSRFAPHRAPEDVGALMGPIAVLQSPQTWRWLRDTWGLDAATTERVAAWAVRALAAALRDESPTSIRSASTRKPASKRSKTSSRRTKR